MREKGFSPDWVSDGDGFFRDVNDGDTMVGEELSLYGSESKSCVFKLFNGIKISVVTFEPFWPVEFFQGGIEAFRQCTSNRVCVGGYSDLPFMCGKAEFF